jgi:hypothetical protein
MTLERGQRGEVAIAVVGAFLGKDFPEVRASDCGQHVQDLVPLVAQHLQTLRRVPDLGWIAIPQLVGHDLVHRDV